MCLTVTANATFCRIAIFAVNVLKGERIITIVEQRPDCSEEEVCYLCDIELVVLLLMSGLVIAYDAMKFIDHEILCPEPCCKQSQIHGVVLCVFAELSVDESSVAGSGEYTSGQHLLPGSCTAQFFTSGTQLLA